MFTLVNSILLKPLALPDPGKLVRVTNRHTLAYADPTKSEYDAYSGEVGHRFRLMWGSVGAKRRWYGHVLRSAPRESRSFTFVRANQHHFVSSFRFLRRQYSV
jgi:hypothetical protein